MSLHLLPALARHFSFRSLLAAVFEALGALWTIVEMSAFFFPQQTEWIRGTWPLFLISGTLWGLWRGFPRLRVSSQINNRDVWVEVRVCDMLSLANTSFVIGSNTTFDTSLEDHTISRTSVQGQFTTRYCDSVTWLDQELERVTAHTPSEPISPTDKPYGKLRRFPMGTVACIQVRSVWAYFLAMAELNEHKVAMSTTQGVLDSLPEVWEAIRTRGGRDAICCPILGTNFGRLGATREALIREIAKSFVAATQAGQFSSRLIIAVHPTDFAQGLVDLPSIGRFLDHECRYAGSGLGMPPVPGKVLAAS